jgi:threonine dehydrogenase-like Zn-dependent dehydrogenase
MVRRKGTVSLVGLPPGDFPTPIFDVVLKRITIRGSIVGTRADLAEGIASVGSRYSKTSTWCFASPHGIATSRARCSRSRSSTSTTTAR